MSETDIQRIERLERTINGLRNSLLLLYNDTEDLLFETTQPSHLQNFESIRVRVERNKKTLETLREITTA